MTVKSVHGDACRVSWTFHGAFRFSLPALFLLIVPGVPTLNCPPTTHKSPNPPDRASALCPACSVDLNPLLAFPLPVLPASVDPQGLILSSGGMLSVVPACLLAWPVFSHCQYLLDSNSKHGIPLGSPFLPVPREHAFQMEHKCVSPAGSHSSFCLGTTESRMWLHRPVLLKFLVLWSYFL